MFTLFNLEIVLTASVLGFIAGSVWYSPKLFMKAWLFSHDKDENSLMGTPKNMKSVMLYSFLSIMALSFTVLSMFNIVDGLPKDFYSYFGFGMLLCFGFVITTKFTEMIYSLNGPHYGKKSQMLFLIDSGYYVVLFTIISSVIYLFSA